MAETSTNIGAPVECNFERRRGDTKDLTLKFKNASSGAALDVSGWTALLTMNTLKEPSLTDSPQTGQQIYQSTGAQVSSPGTDGLMRFDFADFDSYGSPATPVAVGTYYFDIQVIDAAGEKFTPVIGKYYVKQDITKD